MITCCRSHAGKAPGADGDPEEYVLCSEPARGRGREGAVVRTRFTDLVGCAVPIQQAPMNAVSSPDLVAAAVSAGALGSVGLTGMPVPAIEQLLDLVAARADGPLAGNFLLPFLADKAAVTACAERVRVVDCYHAVPDAAVVELAHAAGALVCWQVGDVDEARSAADMGVDLLAVRGIEGGGRMHGRRSLWPLLWEVLDAVGDRVPVLAAGGIGTGRGLAAALAAGADGVRVGTVLAAAAEAGTHPTYRDALLRAGAEDSVLTDFFSNGWPGGPHPARVLRSSLEAAEARDPASPVGVASVGGQSLELAVGSPFPPTTNVEGDVGAMPMYAGESVAFVHTVEPVATIIERIVSDAEVLLTAAGR